jgi:hypothetical protein
MHQKKALGQSFFLMHIFPQNFNEINVSFQNDIGFFRPVPKYWTGEYPLLAQGLTVHQTEASTQW